MRGLVIFLTLEFFNLVLKAKTKNRFIFMIRIYFVVVLFLKRKKIQQFLYLELK